MSRRSLLSCLLVLYTFSFVACTDASLEVESSEATISENHVIFGSENWQTLPYFYGDTTYGTGAIYGRAVGELPELGCTGNLIDDDMFITAEHCYKNNGNTTIVLGLYGESHSNFDLARSEARSRLRDLGLPDFVLASLSVDQFTRWSCHHFWNQSDRADVDYYICDPNILQWTEGYGAERTEVSFALLPGHVWGHINFEVGSRRDDTQIYLVSANDRSDQTQNHILLSPGGHIRDDHGSCGDENEHCFHYGGGIDHRCGSSGGVIFERATNRAFGLVEGSHVWNVAGEDGCSFEQYRNHPWNYNVGSYVNNEVFAFSESAANAWPTGQWAGYTNNWVGGNGGYYNSVTCPNGYLAAGIIGSANEYHRKLGSIGLICMPHQAASNHQLDRAKVVFVGGQDTGFVATTNGDLTTFLAEQLSFADRAEPAQLSVQMCPPGFFIRDVQARTGQFVNEIDHIFCEDPQTGAQTSRYAGWERFGKYTPGALIERSACPEDSYYTGLAVRAGWFVDGFRGMCRYED
ncbi:MAG: hypothetical protein KC561_12180 [Myxococcales bacterium]|nr:hypothetical protein [Myxococcales bacterium]